jgi:hypothetical protein
MSNLGLGLLHVTKYISQTRERQQGLRVAYLVMSRGIINCN